MPVIAIALTPLDCLHGVAQAMFRNFHAPSVICRPFAYVIDAQTPPLLVHSGNHDINCSGILERRVQGVCHPKQQSLCAKVLINAKQTLQRVLSRLGNMHGTLQCIHLSMGCINSVFRLLLIKATCAVGLA